MRETKPIRIQICLDSKTYFKITQEYKTRYGDDDSMSLSNFCRLLILNYFEQREEMTEDSKKLQKVMTNLHNSLDQKHTRIHELENHVKHLEMKLKMAEAKK